MSHATTEAIWRWEDGAEGIRTLWFDQPGRSQNVLDDSALDELDARLVELDNDGSARGLVIRSAKAAGFCAGADLKKVLSFHASSEAEAFVRHGLAVFDHLSSLAVSEVKKNGVFVLPGIGRLVRVDRKARLGRNPATGESIKIPAKKVVKFRVAKAAKDAIVPPKKPKA